MLREDSTRAADGMRNSQGNSMAGCDGMSVCLLHPVESSRRHSHSHSHCAHHVLGSPCAHHSSCRHHVLIIMCSVLRFMCPRSLHHGCVVPRKSTWMPHRWEVQGLQRFNCRGRCWQTLSRAFTMVVCTVILDSAKTYALPTWICMVFAYWFASGSHLVRNGFASGSRLRTWFASGSHQGSHLV